jgi:squalene-hopene/tetraprenyl-beta-curcumene cyclase
MKCIVAATLLLAVSTSTVAQTSSPKSDSPDLESMRLRGTEFLRGMQREDGSWTTSESVGITAIVTSALLRNGVSVDDPVAQRAIDFIVSQQTEKGGIHAPVSRHENYETCVALIALIEANDDGRFDDQIRAAESFLRGLQWDEGEGIESEDAFYGGGGYGSHQRPDLSNTQYLIDALQKAGVKGDDPAMQKILVFVSRAQNLESEFNTMPFAGKVNDGGFMYTPAKGGESKAGLTENGGLQSYGSMTYAGLKSLIYAGLDQKDIRVEAATEWIRRHYTLRENPGMGQQGLYYYFHTFAKTMSALNETPFVAADGVRHDWKAELIERLGSLQRENGSWVNPADRWYEGDPNLVTAYSLLAISHCFDD